MKNNSIFRQKILSDKGEDVKEALEIFLNKGTKEDVPFLIVALQKWANTPLQDIIAAVIFSMKHINAIDDLIEGMKGTKNPRVKTILLRAIWENEYEPSPYLNYIVDEIFDNKDEEFIMEAICLFNALPTPINSHLLKDILRRLKTASLPSSTQPVLNALIATIEEKLARHLFNQMV